MFCLVFCCPIVNLGPLSKRQAQYPNIDHCFIPFLNIIAELGLQAWLSTLWGFKWEPSNSNITPLSAELLSPAYLLNYSLLLDYKKSFDDDLPKQSFFILFVCNFSICFQKCSCNPLLNIPKLLSLLLIDMSTNSLHMHLSASLFESSFFYVCNKTSSNYCSTEVHVIQRECIF